MSPFGRSDSPPPSWYEPPDEPEDDGEREPAEDFAISAGVCSWFSLLAHHDDD